MFISCMELFYTNIVSFQMFQTLQRLNFRLCSNCISNESQLRVALKRQNNFLKKLYSSSTENSDLEVKNITVKDDKNKPEIVKKKDGEVGKPLKHRKQLDREINPRLVRIDNREIPKVFPVTMAERKLKSKACEIFDIAAKEGKNLETFVKAVDMYNSIEKVYKRGMVEFIEEGLKRIPEFGLEKNLDAYKMLVTVFPKEELKAKSGVQVAHMHYPKQQQCAIDLMDKMEGYGMLIIKIIS